VVLLDKGDTTPPPELTRTPRILRGPRLDYPQWLRQQGVQAHVLAAVVVDTLGRVAPDSITILRSPDRAFGSEVRHYLEHAVFEPARAGNRAVPSCVAVTVDFKIKSR
jgi:TonB family protein